jgi:hypothetical protein
MRTFYVWGHHLLQPQSLSSPQGIYHYDQNASSPRSRRPAVATRLPSHRRRQYHLPAKVQQALKANKLQDTRCRW